MRQNLPFLSAASNASQKHGCPLKWKWLVNDVRNLLPFTQLMKIVRLTSPLPDMPRLSSPRLRHGRQLALLSHLNLTLDLHTLCFILSMALFPHLSAFLTSPTVPLPKSRLQSSPITGDPTFLSRSQRPCIVEPETTFPSSTEPRALKSFICPFAPLSPPLNFLWLPQTSSRPLPLAKKKLSIPR